MNVKQLKEELEKYGISCKSYWKKNDLLKIYEQCLKYPNANIPCLKYDNVNYTPLYCREYNSIEHLINYGWTVFKIPYLNVENVKNEFIKWLERIEPHYNDASKGIYRHYIGQTNFMYEIREKTYPIFSQIWNDSDLLTSFDGACYLKPSKKYTNQWFHLDQGQFCLDMCCVQGIVALNDNGEEDGGTLLIEGSHNLFKKYYEKYPREGIICDGVISVNPTDELYKNCAVIKPCLKQGEILLFDSRVVHCNIPPTNKSKIDARIAAYVSMLPRKKCSKEDIEKRIEAYKNGDTSNNWAYGPFFKLTGHPNFRWMADKTPCKNPEISNLSELGKKLVGFN